MGKSLIILAVTVFALLNISQAQAVDINASAEGDGYFQDVVGGSYDFFDSTSGAVSAHYQFFGTSDTMTRNTGYAQFSLSSAPLASDIVSASLYLNIGGAYLSGSTATAGSINHASNSSGATGSAAQRIGGNELVSTIMPSIATGWNSFDVTSYILNDINNGYGWAAFSFDPDGSGDYDNRFAGFSFSSAEGGAPAYLRISTAVAPEPISSALFLVGGAAMAVRQYRKRKKA